MNAISFAARIASVEPFPHFVVQSALEESDSERLLRWLETDAPWRLKIAEFYQQYEFSISEASLPQDIERIFTPARVETIKQCVEESFETTLSSYKYDITVHKLMEGQRIRIHNDYIPGQESHRVLVQLNRGWSDENGGALLFFGSSDARDIRRAIRPLHGSCVGFEISPRSHHAVTPVQGGERFTLVYSFYRE